MVGVRTSPTALSMLLVPRTEGVETKIIKTSYSHAAGTAYVSFDHVLVPVENLLGEENEGLKVRAREPEWGWRARRTGF